MDLGALDKGDKVTPVHLLVSGISMGNTSQVLDSVSPPGVSPTQDAGRGETNIYSTYRSSLNAFHI